MRFLAVNIAIGDTIKTIRKFMERASGPIEVLYDAKHEAAKLFKMTVTPHIVIIDKNGEIVTVAHQIDVDEVRSVIGDQ